MKTKTFPLTAVALALYGLGGSALAQGVPPDSGQLLRDLQQTAPRALPNLQAPQRIEDTEGNGAAANEAVMVKSITITGNQEIPTAELTPLVAGLEGKEQPLARLQAAARRITRYYREKGLAVARAYLPAQNVTDGRVTIAVIEGRIASHRVANQSLVSDERVNALLAGVKDGDVVRGADIDRGLLILMDTPGVGLSRATLQPGASPGTTELLVDVQPAARVSANVMRDNYVSRYTGEYRLSGAFTVASPLSLGDQFGVTALTSGDRLNFTRLNYQLPVGSSGLRVGAAYFDVRYKLGREFAPLLAHGTASSGTVYASYPIVRSQLANLNTTLSYENKDTVDYVDSTSTVTSKKLKIASLGLAGNLQDALAGGGINGAELTWYSGKLDIRSPVALGIDSASAKTNGSYSKYTWGLSRLQRITDGTVFWLNLNGQQASKNLDSSEKFVLGGPVAVRAWPTGEGNGDEGYRGTMELRHNLSERWQGAVFYDFGKVTINKTPFAAVANDRRLAGWGVGLNAAWEKVQVKASLAWRSGGGTPVSIPASAVKSPTLWVQAMVPF